MAIFNTEFTISYPSTYYDIFDSENHSSLISSPSPNSSLDGQEEEFISIQTTPPKIA